ncbi:MAG: bidirectional hydrogenase complex protein HoxU [Acidobacteriia bacterium]|nr:bidirectional hydrogenase complex protein HoxU [Terriglobia bacterium]
MRSGRGGARVNPAAEVKTLVIDEMDVSARADQTILEAARDAGAWIPTLCHLDGVGDIGACRMCLVEVKGSNRLLPACVTRVEEGMAVTTHSERLVKYRRMILELLFAERNHVCAVCVANGACELQTLAQLHGLDHVQFPYRFPALPVDGSHERFSMDHNRCVLCTRCVRVCGEVEGAHTWDLMGRGVHSRVITDLSQPWGTSETCTSCGKCVQVCPTGALFEKNKVGTKLPKSRDFLMHLSVMRGGDR